MITIGGVSLDVSHPKAFASTLETYCMDMRYQYVCDPGFRTEEEGNWFKNRFNLDAIVDTIDEMADKVDVGFIQSCNWDKHLDQAMPFIEKGKPVFIDKPIVGSMADIDRLRSLVAGGAKIGASFASVTASAICFSCLIMYSIFRTFASRDSRCIGIPPSVFFCV